MKHYLDKNNFLIDYVKGFFDLPLQSSIVKVANFRERAEFNKINFALLPESFKGCFPKNETTGLNTKGKAAWAVTNSPRNFTVWVNPVLDAAGSVKLKQVFKILKDKIHNQTFQKNVFGSASSQKISVVAQLIVRRKLIGDHEIQYLSFFDNFDPTVLPDIKGDEAVNLDEADSFLS